MIKTNELRRGNWLMGNKPVQVKSIYDENSVGIGKGDPYYVYAEPPFEPCLIPIELTCEILEKGGFRYEKRLGGDLSNDGDELDFYVKDKHIELFDKGTTSFSVFYSISFQKQIIKEDIKYLHQLQNLYWWLYDEELQINL